MAHVAPDARSTLRRIAALDAAAVAATLDSSAAGLDAAEAERRRARHGPNVVAQDEGPSLARQLLRRLRDTLNLLLLVLAAVSLGLVRLPLGYWPALAGLVLAYFLLTHLMKNWFHRRYGLD